MVDNNASKYAIESAYDNHVMYIQVDDVTHTMTNRQEFHRLLQRFGAHSVVGNDGVIWTCFIAGVYLPNAQFWSGKKMPVPYNM